MDQLDKKAVWPGWETLRLIGRGSYGAVYEIERDMLGEKEKAALKVITIPQNNSDIEQLFDEGYDEASVTNTFHEHLKSIVSEYSLMRKLNGSSNVVNCDDVRYIQHEDGFGWDIYIKMELLTPLSKALSKQPSDEQVMRVGADISRALVLCKKHNIIHRDIKPANIFVSDNGDFKLGDFGIAKTVEKTSGGTKIGTYEYMAPEVYRDQPYGSGVDIYSLGMVLYWLLNERRMPFLPLPPTSPTNSEKEKARRRRFSGEAIPAPAHGSEKLQRIVLKAVAYDPEERYQSAEEMLGDLEALRWQRSFSFEQAPAPAPQKPESAVPTPPAEEKDEDTAPPPVGFAPWLKEPAPASPAPPAEPGREEPSLTPAPQEPEPPVPAPPAEEKDEDTAPPPVGFATWLKEPTPARPEPPAESRREEPSLTPAPRKPEPAKEKDKAPAPPPVDFSAWMKQPAPARPEPPAESRREEPSLRPAPRKPEPAEEKDEGTAPPPVDFSAWMKQPAPARPEPPAEPRREEPSPAPAPQEPEPAVPAPPAEEKDEDTVPPPVSFAAWLKQPAPAKPEPPAEPKREEPSPAPAPRKPEPGFPEEPSLASDEGTVGGFRPSRPSAANHAKPAAPFGNAGSGSAFPTPGPWQPAPAAPADVDYPADEGTVGAFRMPRPPKAGQPRPVSPAESDPLADEGTVGAFRMPKPSAHRQPGPEPPNYITAQGAYRPAAPWQQGQSGQSWSAAPGNGRPGQMPAQRAPENSFWQCECGCRTQLPFCPSCHRPRPAQLPPQPPAQRAPENLFWQCECGCRTQLRYCPNCYRPRPTQSDSPAPAAAPSTKNKKEKKAKKSHRWGK